MIRTVFLILLFISINAFGQKSPTELAQPIVEEGKLLYKSEMASWHGTDLFLENYNDKDNIGGYFSYTFNDTSKCIFFSNSEKPQVIGTISFDSTYSQKTAKIDFTERSFTTKENDLYTIRKIALTEINSDTLLKSYTNTNFNLIPLINGNEKKVFVLTGPKKSGVVIFGNDYLLTFDEDNNLITKRNIHNNILPVPYDFKDEKGNKVEGSIHNHLPETGDFITSTDICTLLLYCKFAEWDTHHVLSEKYLNIWNCETEQLTVITREAFNKISNDIEENKHKNE